MPVLTLQPDATTGVDTYIQENQATFNYGAATTIRTGLGAAGGSIRRGLLQFNISAIPPGSTINSAALTLHCSAEDAGTDYTVGVHRALTAFFEGVRNGASPGAGEDGSTWNHRNANGSVAWAGGAGGASGSDWTASATDSKSITGVGDFVFNVLADVQAWHSGTATNNGWWIINASEGTTSSQKTFDSSDGATAGDRPELVIDYTPADSSVLFSGSGWGWTA